MSIDPVAAGPLPVAGGLAGPGVTAPSLTGAGRRFLSDIVVELGFVDPEQAEEAVEAGRRPGYTPERVLLESGAITPEQLARALAERYGLDHIDLSEFPVDESAAGVLREHAARRYQAAPVGFTGDGTLIVAVADPADSLGLSDIAVMTKLPLRPAVASRPQIDRLLDTLPFMEDPTPAGPQTIGTVIVPPDEESGEESTQALRITPIVAAAAPAPVDDGRVEELERELRAAREALSEGQEAHEATLAAARARADEAATAALGDQAGVLEVERERVRAEMGEEHARELAALREETAGLRDVQSQELDTLRAAHEQALADERARRIDELDTERARTGTAIDLERERHQKELEALRARSEQLLEDERGVAAKEVERERERNETALAEEEARAAEKLDLEEARQASELEALGSRHAAEIASEQARSEQKLAAAQAESTRAVEAARAQAQSAIAAVEAVRAEAEERLVAERERHAAELAAATESTVGADQLAALEEQHAARLEAERERHSQEAATLRDELEAERAAHGEKTGELRDRLAAERTKREELEAQVAVPAEDDERAAELERELEDARAAKVAELDELRTAHEAELEGLRVAHMAELDQLAEADRRADEARILLAELREESERQGELHSLIERELQRELQSARAENESLQAKLADLQEKIADATKAFEAMGSAERRLSEIAAGLPKVEPAADDA